MRLHPDSYKEVNVSDTKSPDVWQMLFEQTPVIIRWFLGILTLGLFTLASVLYKWHRDDMDKVHKRMDALESKVEAGFAEMRGYLMANQVRNQRVDK
jgi:hypothetical protein